MSDAKHTPGPWRVEDDTTLIWGRCTFYDDGTPDHLGIPVAEAHINVGGSSYFTRRSDHDAAYANARLIAAAPAMLDALDPFAVIASIIRPDLPDGTEIELQLNDQRICVLDLGSLRAARKAYVQARIGR